MWREFEQRRNRTAPLFWMQIGLQTASVVALAATAAAMVGISLAGRARRAASRSAGLGAVPRPAVLSAPKKAAGPAKPSPALRATRASAHNNSRMAAAKRYRARALIR
jgi:hypothetical protein